MTWGPPNLVDAAFPVQSKLWNSDLDVLALAAGGVTGVVSGCAVTAQASPDMTLAVASGTVKVAGTQASVTSGNVTITAAHGTLNRIDLVVVNSSGTKSVTAGTAATDPVQPAVPASSVVLAQVYVPAADTAIGSTQIVERRIFVPATVAVSWTMVGKAADQTRASTTTLAADSALLFNMGANTKYRLRGAIIGRALAASDFKYGFNGPAIGGGLISIYTSFGVQSGATISGQTQRVAYETTGIGINATGDNDFTVWLDGIIHNGANSGNFTFDWAQGTSVAENTTVRAGSYLEYMTV